MGGDWEDKMIEVFEGGIGQEEQVDFFFNQREKGTPKQCLKKGTVLAATQSGLRGRQRTSVGNPPQPQHIVGIPLEHLGPCAATWTLSSGADVAKAKQTPLSSERGAASTPHDTFVG